MDVIDPGEVVILEPSLASFFLLPLLDSALLRTLPEIIGVSTSTVVALWSNLRFFSEGGIEEVLNIPLKSLRFAESGLFSG